MIVCYLQGGLGNQLFQHAAASSLAAYRKTGVLVDVSWYDRVGGEKRVMGLHELIPHMHHTKPGQSFFDGANQSFVSRLVKKIQYGNLRYYSEKGLAFNPAFFELNKNTLLEGNFQSYKYHKHLPGGYFNIFFNYKGTGFFNDTRQQAGQQNIVSVHIRRGDYLHNAVTNQVHGILPMEYYEKAIDYMRIKLGNPQFFFFSDDPAFINEKFGALPGARNVSGEGKLSDVEELVLMAACSHHIIANSSYSWWAAYGQQQPRKEVIYPLMWFRKPPLGFILNDLIPSAWTGL